MGEDTATSIVKLIQQGYGAGHPPQSILRQLRSDGYTDEAIKKSIAFLPLEQFKAFSSYFSEIVPRKRISWWQQKLLQFRQETSSVSSATSTTTSTHTHHTMDKGGAGQQHGTLFFNRVQILVIIGALFLFFIWLQIATGANLFSILLGFLPTLLTIVLTIIILEHKGDHYLAYLWLVAVILVIVFYVLLEGSSGTLTEHLDLKALTAINIIFSSLAVFLLNTTWIRSKKHLKHLDTLKKEHHKLIEENTQLHQQTKFMESRLLSVEQYVQSIEDKCKAINFAVGRVYKDKNGGSPSLRKLLRIDPSTYNQFSTIESFQAEKDRALLIELITKIRSTLMLYTKTEKEVFGTAGNKLKIIERAKDGSGKVIDVLAKNDKDPVRAYHESALLFCKNALEELHQNPQ